MIHIEAHYLETARDAASLEHAGLPRYDLETGTVCGSCSVTVGEIVGTEDETVAWRPFAVVLTGEKIDTVCKRCLRTVLEVC